MGRGTSSTVLDPKMALDAYVSKMIGVRATPASTKAFISALSALKKGVISRSSSPSSNQSSENRRSSVGLLKMTSRCTPMPGYMAGAPVWKKGSNASKYVEKDGTPWVVISTLSCLGCSVPMTGRAPAVLRTSATTRAGGRAAVGEVRRSIARGVQDGSAHEFFGCKPEGSRSNLMSPVFTLLRNFDKPRWATTSFPAPRAPHLALLPLLCGEAPATTRRADFR